MTVDSSHAEIAGNLSRARVGAALRRRKNWEQLVRFCIVGASGYAVNLWVFSTLVLGEVGLAGEVRAVGQIEPRLAEAAKMGFKRVVLPKGSARRVEDTKLELLGVETLGDALRTLF